MCFSRVCGWTNNASQTGNQIRRRGEEGRDATDKSRRGSPLRVDAVLRALAAPEPNCEASGALSLQRPTHLAVAIATIASEGKRTDAGR